MLKKIFLNFLVVGSPPYFYGRVFFPLRGEPVFHGQRRAASLSSTLKEAAISPQEVQVPVSVGFHGRDFEGSGTISNAFSILKFLCPSSFPHFFSLPHPLGHTSPFSRGLFFLGRYVMINRFHLRPPINRLRFFLLSLNL